MIGIYSKINIKLKEKDYQLELFGEPEYHYTDYGTQIGVKDPLFYLNGEEKEATELSELFDKQYGEILEALYERALNIHEDPTTEVKH